MRRLFFFIYKLKTNKYVFKYCEYSSIENTQNNKYYSIRNCTELIYYMSYNYCSHRRTLI